jgi:hypothetical protein
MYMYMYVHNARFGSFEIFKTRDSVTGRVGPSVGRVDILHQLLDYVTSTFYPEVRCVMNMRDIKTSVHCILYQGFPTHWPK